MLTYNNLSVDIYTLQYKFKKLNIYPGNFSYFSTLIFKNKKHMFTLGIFTTHLPYIALVVFYAFFSIFGISKASSGEIQSVDRMVLVEITSTETFSVTTVDNQYNTQNFSDTGFLPFKVSNIFPALQKLVHKTFYLAEYRKNNFYTTLFSRPPPLFS